MRINLIAIIILMLFSNLAVAQEGFKKEKMVVLGKTYPGYSIKIPYSETKTKRYWLAYLKDNKSKVSEKKHYIELKETYWKAKDDPTTVYSVVSGDSTESKIWIGYTDPAPDYILTAIEDQLNNLPFLMDKYHLQFKIQEAEDAATYLSKELKNEEKEGDRLVRSLDRNAHEKIRLEEALVKNAEEKVQLESNIEKNKVDQKEKAKALDEVKQQIENLKKQLQGLLK